MRGERYNEKRASQSRDYSGVRYGNITPTDIDGLIEYKNKGYIIFEIKTNGTKVEGGQLWALERICDDFQKAGKHSILIIASHNTPENKTIDLASCTVEKYRHKGKWYPDTKNTPYIGKTVKELSDVFINFLNGVAE